MREPRRELALACLMTLLGAVVVLIAAGRRWQGSSTGDQMAPLIRALALVALAGVVAVLAARGWVRRAVGAALALAGVAIVLSSIRQFTAADVPVWPALAVVGGMLVLGAGVLGGLRASTWPALGARYDAPTQRPITAGDAWDALDRGEDPTSHEGDETRPRT